MFHFNFCSLSLALSVNMRRFLVSKPRDASSTAATAPVSPEAGSEPSSTRGTAAPQPDPNANPQLSSTSTATQAERVAVCNAAAAADTVALLLHHSPQILFPKRHFGKTARAFSPGWYRGRPWLGYSVKLDACFCFPCRKFGGNNDRDLVFTKQGFNNWKTALEKDKGLTKRGSSLYVT